MEGVLNSMVSVSADTDEDSDLGYANQNVALVFNFFPLSLLAEHFTGKLS